MDTSEETNEEKRSHHHDRCHGTREPGPQSNLDEAKVKLMIGHALERAERKKGSAPGTGLQYGWLAERRLIVRHGVSSLFRLRPMECGLFQKYSRLPVAASAY
jgi:hypothetical protein